MKIYTDLSEIEKDSGLLGYVRALQRAWNPDGGLGISQIGCLGKFLRFLSRNANRLSLRNSFMLGIGFFGTRVLLPFF